MATGYPSIIDNNITLPQSIDLVTPVKAEVVNQLRDAIIAVEAELGVDPSREYGTVRARLDALEALIGGGGGGGQPIVQEQEVVPITVLGQTAFALTRTPLDSSAVEMYVNKLKQQYNSDYTVSGSTVTYTGSLTLTTADDAEFWYIVSGTGGGGGGGGGESLAATLLLGNSTGGTNIVLSASNINASGGTISLADNTSITGLLTTTTTLTVGTDLFVNNDATITGKLTVGGLIDPTGMVFDEQTTVPGGAPGAAKGTIWVRDDVPNVLVFTDDAGTDHDLQDQTGGFEIDFKLTGVFSGAGVPGTFEPPYPAVTARVISSVTILRRVAGGAGTTRVDVLKNGVSIFASDPAKPQVAFSDGANATNTVSTFLDNTLAISDMLDIELETVETGSAEDLVVVVRFA